MQRTKIMNGNSFLLEGVGYYRDGQNDRCYRVEASETGDTAVSRRISRKAYETALFQAEQIIISTRLD